MAERPSFTTSEVGAVAEAAVALALVKAGHAVFVPLFSGHGRVDLIYESGDSTFRRVQCKSARLLGAVLTFSSCSHTGGVERSYLGDADDFGVYCPTTQSVYLVPVEAVPGRVVSLRLGPTRNNQFRGVRWADPYRLT